MTSMTKAKNISMRRGYEYDKKERKDHAAFMRSWIKRDLWLTVKEIEGEN